MTSLRSDPRPGKRPPGAPGGTEPAARDPDRGAIRQGLSILAVLIAAAATVFFLDPIQGWLDEGPEVVVTATRSRGLVPGAQVWVAGTRSGRVESVTFRPPDANFEHRVLIRATLREGISEYVRAGATAWIQPSGLLAPTVLMIDPGPPDAPPFDFGDTLRVEERITSEALLARTDTAWTHLDSLRHAGRRVLQALEHGDGTLARLRRDPTLPRTFERDLAALRRITSAVGENRGLEALLRAHRTGRMDTVLARAGRAADSLALRDPALRSLGESLAALQRRAARVDSMLAAGRGTAGRFLADGELREQLRLLREDLGLSREALFDDPFRWLRIRLF